MKILIVEDELEIAKIIQECLEAEGFDCCVCHDGNSAIRLYVIFLNHWYKDSAINYLIAIAF